MYILINEDNRPFAIIAEFSEQRVIKAIEEEYMVKEVEISELPNPDWGETKEFTVEAKDLDEGDEVGYTLEITRLVSY